MQGSKAPPDRNSWLLGDMRKSPRIDKIEARASDGDIPPSAIPAMASAGGGGWLGRDHRNRVRQEQTKQMEQQLLTLQHEKDSLQKELDEGRLEHGRMAQDLKKYADLVQKLKDESDERRKEKVRTEQEAERAKRQATKLQDTIDDLAEQLDGLKTALQARDKEVEDMKGHHLKTLREKDNSFVQIQKQLADNYQAAVDGQSALRARLEEEEREAGELKRRLKESDDKAAKLEARLKAAVNDLGQTQQALRSSAYFEDHFKGMEAAAVEAQRDATSREEEVRKHRESIFKLSQEIEVLKARLVREEKAKEDLKEDMDLVNNRHADMAAKVATMQDQLKEATEQKQKALLKVEDERAKRMTQERECAVLTKRADSLAAELAEMSARVSAMEAEVKELSKQLQQAEGASEAEKKRRQRLEDLQDDLNGMSKGADARVQELERATAELEVEVDTLAKAKAKAEARAEDEHRQRVLHQEKLREAATRNLEMESALERYENIKVEMQEVQEALDQEQRKRKAAEINSEKSARSWREEKDGLLEKLEVVLKEREEERVAMAAANKVMEDDLLNLRTEIRRVTEAAKEEEARLKAAVQELTIQAARNDAHWQEEMADLQGRLQLAEKDGQRKELQLVDLETQIADFRRTVVELEARGQQASNQVESTEEDKSSIEEKLKETMDALKEAESVILDLETSRDKLKAELNNVEREASLAKGSLGLGADQLDETRNILSSREEEVTRLMEEVERLKVKLEQTERDQQFASGEAEQMKVMAGELTKELEDVRKVLTEREDEITRGEGKVEELVQRVNELEVLSREIELLQCKADEAELLQSALEKMEQAFKESELALSSSEKNLTTMGEDLRKLEQEKDYSEKLCEKLNGHLEEAGKNLAGLKGQHEAEMDDMKQAMEAAEEAKCAAEAEKEQLEVELAKEKKSAKESDLLAEEARERCTMLQNLLDDASNRLSDAEDSVKKLEAGKKDLEADLARARSSEVEAEQREKELLKQCKDLEDQLGEAGRRLNEEKVKQQRLEEAVEGLQADIIKARTVLEEVEQSSKDAKKRSMELEDRLSEVERELRESEEVRFRLEGEKLELETVVREREKSVVRLQEQLVDARSQLEDIESHQGSNPALLADEVAALKHKEASPEAGEALEAFKKAQLLLGLCALWKAEVDRETQCLRERLDRSASDREAGDWAVKMIGRDLQWTKEALHSREAEVASLKNNAAELHARLRESAKELKATQAQVDKAKNKARAFYKVVLEQREIMLNLKQTVATEEKAGRSGSSPVAAAAVLQSAAAAEASVRALRIDLNDAGPEDEGKEAGGKRENDASEDLRPVAKVLKMDVEEHAADGPAGNSQKRSPLRSSMPVIPSPAKQHQPLVLDDEDSLEALKRRNAQLERSLATNNDKVARMFEDMTKAQRETDVKTQQLAGREMVLTAVEADLGRERKCLGEAMQENGALKGQMEKLERELQGLQAAVETSPARIPAVSTNEVKKLSDEKASLEEKLEISRQRIELLEKQVSTLSSQVMSASGSFTDVSLRLYHGAEPNSPVAVRATPMAAEERYQEYSPTAMHSSPAPSGGLVVEVNRGSVTVSPSKHRPGGEVRTALFGRSSVGKAGPGVVVRQKQAEIDELIRQHETERALARREVRNWQGEVEELRRRLKEQEKENLEVEGLRRMLKESQREIEALRKQATPMGKKGSPSAKASQRKSATDARPPSGPVPFRPGIPLTRNVYRNANLSTEDTTRDASKALRPRDPDNRDLPFPNLRPRPQDSAKAEASDSETSVPEGGSKVKATLEKFKRLSEKRNVPAGPELGKNRRNSLGPAVFGNENTTARMAHRWQHGEVGTPQRTNAQNKVEPPQRSQSPPLPSSNSTSGAENRGPQHLRSPGSSPNLANIDHLLWGPRSMTKSVEALVSPLKQPSLAHSPRPQQSPREALHASSPSAFRASPPSASRRVAAATSALEDASRD